MGNDKKDLEYHVVIFDSDFIYQYSVTQAELTPRSHN